MQACYAMQRYTGIFCFQLWSLSNREILSHIYITELKHMIWTPKLPIMVIWIHLPIFADLPNCLTIKLFTYVSSYLFYCMLI